MKYAWIAFILITSSAFAAARKSYDLKLNVAQNGQKFASPQIVVKEGETTTVIEKIGGEERFIQVEAADESIDGLKMKFAIGKIDDLGERVIIARPEVIVDENTPATLTIGEEGHPEKISLSVLATPKSSL